MRFIEESQIYKFKNFVYEMDKFDFEDIICWVNSVIDKGIIITDVITLRDTEHNYDEGNNSIQLEYPFNKEQMLNKIKEKEVDIISFNGKYKSNIISFCYNLQNNILCLGFSNKDNIDRIILESELSLAGKGICDYV